MENIEKKVIKVSKRKLMFFLFIIALLAFILIRLSFLSVNNIGSYNTGVMYKTTQSGNNALERMVPPEYYPYQNSTPSVNDTREFLKTSYSADIKTRNVKSALRDVKSAVRVASGRIDNLNENEKYGYVSFVIPKINFENFKDEIESITNEKLIVENISSENLLGQKQNIEEQNKNATDSLLTLQQQKKDLTSKHTQSINKFESNITELESKLVQIDLILPRISDSVQITALQGQRNTITGAIDQLKQQLLLENSSYNTKNQNLKNQIDSVNGELSGIAKQDTNFTNNIETVNGSIRVEWVSLWQLVKVFSPIHPTIIIVILVIIIWYILKRKSFLPKIELV